MSLIWNAADLVVDMEYGENSSIDENGQQIQGCPTEFWGTAIVCFLDLLGFSQFVFDEFSQKSDGAIKRFLAVRNHPFLKSQGQKSVRYVWKGSDGLGQAPYVPMVHTSSDSVVLSIALPKDISIRDAVPAVFSLNNHISWLVKHALDQGFALRGAIEIGEVYWNERDIIGPAFINAYQIEQKHAKHVRVILGPDLLAFTLQAQEATDYDLVCSMWCDEDGLIMLKPDLHLASVRDELREKYQQLQEAAPQRVRAKYDSPLKYLQGNAEMPKGPNFDLAYVSELLGRYRYQSKGL